MDILPYLILFALICLPIAVIVAIIKALLLIKKKQTRKGIYMLAATLVAAVIMVLLLSVPFFKYRQDTRSGLCCGNRRLLEHSKEVWAIRNNKKAGDPVNEEEVYDFIKGGKPVCPDGGEYTLNVIDKYATCSYGSHTNEN